MERSEEFNDPVSLVALDSENIGHEYPQKQ